MADLFFSHLFFLLMLCSVFVSAQYGQQQNYGGGNGGAYYPQQQTSGYAYQYQQQQQAPSTPDIIDNEVVEAPTIRCTDHGVEFSINTRNPFRGNIYVQGQFGLSECRREFYNNDAPHASIEVQLNDCGMIRERRPHGMSYSLVIITNFHPRFVTKVDRAYKILCSYQHTERPVGVDLEVGSVPTVPIASDAILVPDCEYTMRLGDVNGPMAPGAVKVGDLIFHRWECQNSPIYGMLVKNCRVFDGGNMNATLIDERGCPTHSGVIQSPPVYSENLNLAYAPIFAFHFPDRTQMNFRCQIQSCNKQDNECLGMTPPNCPQSYGPNQNVDPRVNMPYGPQQPQQQEAYASYSSSALYPSVPTPPTGNSPAYIGAGLSPTWPPNALPLGSVLQSNPSQVLQGLGRPWPRRRTETREGQTLERQILVATQQLRRHENGSWPPGLLVLDRGQQQQQQAGQGPRMAAAVARRFFRPTPQEVGTQQQQQEEQRLRQRRAEEKTQDVVATSTVINDGLQGLDWSFENGKEQVRPRSAGAVNPRASKMANSYCLDRGILVALLAALGLLGALVCSMLCYLLWDFLFSRHKCRRSLISGRGWKRSRSSSERRLGLFGAKVSAKPQKPFQFTSPAAASIVPTESNGTNARTNTNMPPFEHQEACPRTALSNILNAGLTRQTGAEQRIPPPVPPKPFQ